MTRKRRPANRINFTDRTLKALPIPEAGQVDYWDKNMHGFGMRVSYGGRKSFQVIFRDPAKRRPARMVLGPYPIITLAEARGKALEAFRQVYDGTDPRADRQAAQAARQAPAAPTFAELASQYLEQYAKREKKSWQKDERAIKQFNAKFGDRDAGNIETREIAEFLVGVRDGGAGIWANRMLEIIRRVYSWGMEPERQIVTHNPCTGMKKLTKENTRTRWLTASEIKAVHDAFPAIDERMAAFFRLVLATGQRAHEEVRHMHDDQLDLEAGWWTIPAEYSKNGKAHAVPLNAEAIAAIEVAKAERGDSQWMFPMKGRSGTPMSEAAHRKPLAKLIAVAGIQSFMPHDLRRTMTTHMEGDLDIARETTAKLTNHADASITGRYMRHSYDRKKRIAMDAWGDRLQEIVTDQTVAASLPDEPSKKLRIVKA